MAEEERIEMRR